MHALENTASAATPDDDRKPVPLTRVKWPSHGSILKLENPSVDASRKRKESRPLLGPRYLIGSAKIRE